MPENLEILSLTFEFATCVLRCKWHNFHHLNWEHNLVAIPEVSDDEGKTDKNPGWRAHLYAHIIQPGTSKRVDASNTHLQLSQPSLLQHREMGEKRHNQKWSQVTIPGDAIQC